MSQRIGAVQKIGYSFLGLLAGNVASLITLLLIAVLPRLNVLPGITRLWGLDFNGALGLSLAIAIFSMSAWVVIGLPFVLLLSSEIAAEFYWAPALLIGAILGAIAMLLFFGAINGGHLDFAALANPAGRYPLYLAALIAGIALLVYCTLVRNAIRTADAA